MQQSEGGKKRVKRKKRSEMKFVVVGLVMQVLLCS